MAIAFFDRSRIWSSVDATTYTTVQSFTPADGSLMLCFVCASSAETTQELPTSCVGNSVTYSLHTTNQFKSGVCTICLWAGIASGATAGTTTVSGWTTNRTGAAVVLLEVTGADVSGTALGALAEVQVDGSVGAGTATTGTITTMTGPLGTGNLPCAFFDHTVQQIIQAGTGCSLGSSSSYATPARGSGSVWATPPTYVQPVATWATAAAWRGLGAEVKAAAADTGMPPHPFVQRAVFL